MQIIDNAALCVAEARYWRACAGVKLLAAGLGRGYNQPKSEYDESGEPQTGLLPGTG